MPVDKKVLFPRKVLNCNHGLVLLVFGIPKSQICGVKHTISDYNAGGTLQRRAYPDYLPRCHCVPTYRIRRKDNDLADTGLGRIDVTLAVYLQAIEVRVPP